MSVCICVAAREINYHTHAEFVFSHLWWSSNVTTSTVLYIKACSDAHIALASQVDNTQESYEVIIGGWENTQSAIRAKPGGDLETQVETVGILNCDIYKPLWVRWDGGHIEVGTGIHVGDNVIMRWQNPDVKWDVQAVGVSSGYDFEADWSFLPGQGKLMLNSIILQHYILCYYCKERTCYVMLCYNVMLCY